MARMDIVRRVRAGAFHMRVPCLSAIVVAALLCVACEREQPVVDEARQSESAAVMPTPTPTAVSAGEPTATAVPELTPTPAPTATPTPELPPNTVQMQDEPPVRDLFALAQRFGRAEAGGAPLTRTLPPDPDCCDVGHHKRFFVTDLIERRVYEVDAELLAVSENAYWYADEETELTAQELERTADVFEREIRPAIVTAIGDIWKPGVDGDPRLTVLHTPLVAAAGYFSSSDSYPRTTHPHSNEREMIVMDGDWLRPGSRQYFSVLAHEFQHAVHWNQDLGEDVWVNEGMSEVATEIAGYEASFIDIFLQRPESQLNFWPDEPRDTLSHYGGATLFVEYLAEHYGGDDVLSELAREPMDGVNGVQRYLSQYGVDFADVFADWTVANFLDGKLDWLADTRLDDQLEAYRYSGRSVELHRVKRVDGEFAETTTQPQLSARYYEVRLPEGDAAMEFEGEATVAQVGTECHSGRYCWWSGNGDSIDTTLEREFDLSGVESAMLEFWMWYEIEEDWDYAFVSVSTDGGEMWTTLDGEHTTREDPLGANYGAGITGISGSNRGGGKSGEWVLERMDLSEYAGAGGESVLVRFEYITDEGVNLDGIVIDDIAVAELGFADDAETDGDWQANDWRSSGWRRIDNVLPQAFVLRLIEFGKDGGVSVSEPPGASFSIAGFGERLDYAVLVVAPMTHTTYQPAGYTLRVEARQ